MEKKRIILTGYQKYTGIGKYVYDLMQMNDTNSQTISLSFKKNSVPHLYYGKVIVGRFRIPFTSGWVLNTNFQGLAFYSLKNRLNVMERSQEYIFHYSDYVTIPFTTGLRSVLTIHDLFHVSDKYLKYGYKRQRFLERNVKKYLSFEYVVSDSEYVAKEAVDFGFKHKPTVIYPPVAGYIKPNLDKAVCRKKNNLPEDKFLVLSVSSNDPRKNIKGVITTMKMLGSKYSLVRVGPPIEGAFNFSNIKEEQINEIYNACDVLFLPTFDEGFGYPLAEAMSAGLPVVSSDIDVVREICGDAAILADPSSPELMSTAIKEAIENGERLRERGFKKSQTYQMDKFSSDLQKFYRTIN